MKESSAVVIDENPLEALSFREYRPADLRRCVEITASAWPEFAGNIDLTTIEWYGGSATWKEVACISDKVVGILFGKVYSDLSALGRLRIFLKHSIVYLKMFFGLYGKIPHRLTFIRAGMSDDRNIAANSPKVDGEIAFFAVDAAYRRKGIGKVLMDRFINHAKMKGARRISVYTTDPGSDWGFYEKYGFKKHGSFRDHFMSFARKEEVMAIIYVLDLKTDLAL